MPQLKNLQVGEQLPQRAHTPSNVSLFLYNAAIWNAHRIHYDARYASEVEHHAGVVIDGPLQGDWLAQVVSNWLNSDGELIEFEYSNRKAAHLGETLCSGGEISAIDVASGEVQLTLFIKNAVDEVISPGAAVVRLPRA